MADNNFLSAKRMAQELVRARVTPDQLGSLLEYARENQDEGGKAFLDYVQAQDDDTIAEPLRQACQVYLRKLEDDMQALGDMLGWGVGFMRYYRGEGNRPLPNSRPSQPRPPQQQQQQRQRPSRRRREPQEVKFPMGALKEGQELEGVVKRIMPYGVFVSVGSERDGLVHVSEMSDGFTGDPNDVVKVDETIQVWVKNVDQERGRISLTMKGAEAAVAEEAPRHERTSRSDSDGGRRQSGRGGGSRRRGVSSLRRSSGPAKLYQDDAPKEMTAMAEALRQALSDQDDEEDESDQGSSRQKKGGRSEELAEVYRRTLYGE